MGILQAKILEWVVMPSSRGSSQPRDRTQVSHINRQILSLPSEPSGKSMTNLDSVLKSRDVTWPNKVHSVKAMVFLLFHYRYESWTTKKAEQ